MRVSRKILGSALMALASILSNSAYAQTCKLERQASLELTDASDGTALVPVSIGETPQYLRLELQAPYSFIDSKLSRQLSLPTQPLPKGIGISVEGSRVTSAAETTVQIDRLVANGFHFLVAPRLTHRDPREIGVIGLDLLSKYDVELDLSGHRLILFSQTHCSGNVVYWPNSATAAVPIKRQATGVMTFQLKVDGHAVDAAFSTRYPGSYLAFSTARRLFDLEPNSPGMKATDEHPPFGERGTRIYSYPFKAITADGIVITNPEIFVWDDHSGNRCDGKPHSAAGRTEACYGEANMALGLKELRVMHLYFAFGQNMVYFTAAGGS